MTAAYVVCKDEHLAAIITKPDITAEEIAELPNSKNIMLRKFAHQLHEEYQKIKNEMLNQTEHETESDRVQRDGENTKDEAGNIPF